jgi:hypothetical protein
VHVDGDVVNGMVVYQPVVLVCVLCGGKMKTLIIFRLDVTSNVHLLDFNKRILILKMHGANIKSTRNVSWSKGGRCVGLTSLQPSCADCFKKSGSFNLLKPSEPVQACNGIALPYIHARRLQGHFIIHLSA